MARAFRCLVLLALACSSAVTALKSVEEYINIRGGTASKKDFSHGNSLPLLARPWGFCSWSVQSNTDSSWWFYPRDRKFLGIRNTRQPSPWINSYGDFRLTASMPGLSHASDKNLWSGYNPDTSTWSPYYFKTTLLAYGTETEQTTLEFAPSRHGGIMRLQFPAKSTDYANSGFDQTRRIALLLNTTTTTTADKAIEDLQQSDSGSSSITQIEGVTFIVGYSAQNSGGVPTNSDGTTNFKHYFAAGIYSGKDGANSIKPSDSYADADWAWVDFSPDSEESNVITVRVASSFISAEQALVNLQREVGVKMSFEQLVDEARAEWRQQVSKMTLVDVGHGSSSEAAQDEQRTVFYSTQYRASLFPRQLTEVTSGGELVHWSPYDASGRTFPGPLSTDSGFWDAYSTLYPLHTLLNVQEVGTMIAGWLNAYKEGGWLPKWSSPGFRTGMVGTMGDVSLADAIVKKIGGFDVALAYEAIRKDAFEVPPQGVEGVGRVCLESYLEYGYIPNNAPMTTGGECYEVVSRTLNYLQADWAIAQAAAVLGHDDDAEILRARASNFSLLFNTKSGFFQSLTLTAADKDKGKAAAFKFKDTFDQYAWGGDYTEGGPWQYRFYLPYDPQGLSKMYADSGRDVCDELLRAQTSQSTYHIGAYDTEIHEQTELPENCWGQYAHNNQPVHHMLYMFQAVDKVQSSSTGKCSAKGQLYLRKAMQSLYKPGDDMFPGDEDNGQMSAFFLLSSLGLYSLSPGSLFYNVGVPLFSRVEVKLPGGNLLVVEAKNNNSPQSVYVHAVSFNGKAVATTIAYDLLMQGGTLTFELSEKPVVM